MSDDICKHGWSRRFCEQCSQARIIASLKGPGDKGMLANPPDDLVERVARAMAVGDGFDPDWITNNDTPDCPQPVWGLYKHSARAAIAVVLEEAAKVCDAIETKLSDQWRANYKVCDYTQGASDGANDCAAAIRALVKEPTPGSQS